MRHVVVVEDDPHNGILFRKLIEKRLDARVTLTESPAELFETLAARTVALVVMDVSLRDSQWNGQAVNGVGLCRLIKDDPLKSHIPVVLATAHAMRGDAQRLLVESGADEYVAKPVVDHEAFVALVRALMEKAA
jgi:CheY-like chemotaxis protein